MGEKMNKYLYIPLLIWLPILSLVTPANSADLKYSENKPLISRKDDINISINQEELNDKLALNDSLNIAKNDNSLLLSLVKNFILVTSDNPLCPFMYQVGEQKNPTSVSFLPQVKAGNIFKGIYDFDQNEVCQVDNNNQIISRLVSTEETAIKGEEKPLSKNVYILKPQEFSPRQTNYKYFQTVQTFKTNRNRQTSNYQSLGLIKSNPIKPISINKNIGSQSLKSDQRQNFLKAISPQGRTYNSFQTNKIKTYQSPVPSSPLLETMKQEREKQLQQTRKQQEQLKQRLIKQAEQRRNNAHQKNQSKYSLQTGKRFSY